MTADNPPATATKVFTIEIAAPIQRVWAEITRQGVQQAMFATRLKADLRPGGKMIYTDRTGKKWFVAGEVIEVSPPTRLAHTFRFHDIPEPEQRVEWDLLDLGGRTRVTVTHSRLDAAPRTAKRISGGWPAILADYRTLVEHGKLPFGKRFTLALMSACGPFMGGKVA